MSITIRLLLLILINFAILVVLLVKLMQLGNSYSKALQIAWDLILADNQGALDYSVYQKIAWVAIFKKVWLFTLGVYGLIWMIAPEGYYSLILLALICIHIYWYWQARLKGREAFDQIMHLNAHWGIVYKELTPGSPLNEKTLAELDLRKKNLLVLAIERNGQLSPFPKGLEILTSGDRLVIFGDLGSYYSNLD